MDVIHKKVTRLRWENRDAK